MVALAAPSALQAEVVVRTGAQGVEVKAVAAGLAELLDRVAQATGMVVSYEGGRPTARVSVDIPALPASHAVMRILEGQSLNYALRLDRTGTRVETLIVSGTAGGSGASVAASAPLPTPPPPPEPMVGGPERINEPGDAADKAAAAAPAPSPSPAIPFGNSGVGMRPDAPAGFAVLPTPPPPATRPRPPIPTASPVAE